MVGFYFHELHYHLVLTSFDRKSGAAVATSLAHPQPLIYTALTEYVF